jgi:uncharacterized protein YndB with AHSA1/START domain
VDDWIARYRRFWTASFDRMDAHILRIETQGQAQMSTTLADDELLITRTFDAPASLLFALWSKPEHLKRWMGPASYSCPEAQIDFRVGGAYRAMILSPEHGENWFGGVYREIVPNRRLVFTFAWDNDGPSAGVETLITITFEERNGKTVQTFHQRPFINVDRRDSHVRGWTGAFDKLAAYALAASKEQTR